MTRVATTMIASAIGRWRPRLRLEVDEVGAGAGRPARSSPAGPRGRGSRATVLLAGVGDEGVGGDRLDRRHLAAQPLRRQHFGDSVDAAHAPGDQGRLRRRRAFDVDPDRGVVEGRELALDRLVGLAGAGRLRQHGRVDGVELDPEEGQAEDDQQQGAERGHRDRSPHHEAREPVPEAALGGPRVGLGAALEEARGAGVDAVAEQGQHRRQHGQRDQRREQRHQGAAEAHRVEEALREDQQRGERGGDGQRGEEDGAPGGGEDASHRRQARPVLGDLLAVAGDDEEAVVDSQAQAERRGQVEGEDRDRGEFAGQAQDQEGADDRQAADHQRQHRGDEAAEEQQREQEEQREGEHLGHPQVLLDLFVHLLLGDREAADEDTRVGGELVGDFAAGVLHLLVAGRLQRDREVGRVARRARRRRGSGCRSSR